jgi:hypothetical protein
MLNGKPIQHLLTIQWNWILSGDALRGGSLLFLCTQDHNAYRPGQEPLNVRYPVGDCDLNS